ncbi:Lon protease family protein [Alteromonas sediminis]|nr:ATP-binding protein [Alteromonas sediminis]
MTTLSYMTPGTSQLDIRELTPKLQKRLIQNALNDETALSATFIGQERASEALSFGLTIESTGYNLYVMGEHATGRYTLVQEHIRRQVANKPTPDDWCYINNFDDQREPFALRMHTGEAKAFLKDMTQLIDELLDTFPAAFDNPSYQRKKVSLSRQFEDRYDEVINEIEALAQTENVALYEENNSISFAPIVDGKPIDDEKFAQLDEQTRQHFIELISALEEKLSEKLIALPVWKRELSEQIRKLNRETVEQGIKPLLKHREHRYASDLGVLKYLRQMRTPLIDAIINLSLEENKEDRLDESEKRSLLEEHFLPNVAVGHTHNEGAPVIYEANPTYQNLFGQIEYTHISGSAFTNHRMIRPGALHRANGGYLLIEADKLLVQPFVWDALKRAIKFNRLKMDLPQQDVGMVNAITLTPQDIELQVKIILLGSRELYYNLQDYDSEFDELFRVLVDFDHEIPLTKQSTIDFVGRARLHALHCGIEKIEPAAMCRLVEFSLRMASHQQKLSARFADVIELINEANVFVKQDKSEHLGLSHIEQALKAKKRRSGRVSQSLLEDIKEGHVLIATEGHAIGTVNGLTVLEIGDSVFGTPARITSTVYAGASGVVDIEREVELGQPIHSKGVMLLTGYLGHKYAQHFPLTLSANIALEQSYGYIDGDSASLGELIALISALTEIKVNQSLAVTGSINQYGEVQAVGGVNEKIEGFFELCKHRGLNGEQGVVIPASNHINLVLNKPVTEAVKKGHFHIYTVETVDDAVSLLMQKEAGQLSARGRYPKNSINYHALNRLYNIANIVNGEG